MHMPGVTPTISKPPHKSTPAQTVDRARCDRDIPLLHTVYTRMSRVVAKYIAPVLKDLPEGRAWLRLMYAELHHTVPFTMLLEPVLHTPFGVNCGTPHRVLVDDTGVDVGRAALLQLVHYAHAQFRTLPRATQANLLQSRVITLARHRLANIGYLCDCLHKP